MFNLPRIEKRPTNIIPSLDSSAAQSYQLSSIGTSRNYKNLPNQSTSHRNDSAKITDFNFLNTNIFENFKVCLICKKQKKDEKYLTGCANHFICSLCYLNIDFIESLSQYCKKCENALRKPEISGKVQFKNESNKTPKRRNISLSFPEKTCYNCEQSIIMNKFLTDKCKVHYLCQDCLMKKNPYNKNCKNCKEYFMEVFNVKSNITQPNYYSMNKSIDSIENSEIKFNIQNVRHRKNVSLNNDYEKFEIKKIEEGKFLAPLESIQVKNVDFFEINSKVNDKRLIFKEEEKFDSPKIKNQFKNGNYPEKSQEVFDRVFVDEKKYDSPKIKNQFNYGNSAKKYQEVFDRQSVFVEEKKIENPQINYKKYFDDIEKGGGFIENNKSDIYQFGYYDSESKIPVKIYDIEKKDLVSGEYNINPIRDDNPTVNKSLNRQDSKSNSIAGFTNMIICSKCQEAKQSFGFLCDHNICTYCLVYYCCYSISSFFSSYSYDKKIQFSYYCPVCSAKISVPTAMIQTMLKEYLRNNDSNYKQFEYFQDSMTEWIPFLDGLSFYIYSND